MKTLHLQLTVDEHLVAQCAKALLQRLPPGQWAVLTALAAEIVGLQEARTGSVVLVVPADRQTAEVARALGAPVDLERQVAALHRAAEEL